MSECVRACVRMRARALAEIGFDSVLVLSFVMGYVLHFGEITQNSKFFFFFFFFFFFCYYYYIRIKRKKSSSVHFS